ncbi:hypothetical protein K3495_g944 [Podosphaera aphanis]|nr:hypothetical protein K3495_g944 [Podosphaera aphanis]
MASLLKQIDPSRYSHRTYIVSSGDDFSSGKALEIERIIQRPFHPNGPIDAGTWDRHIGFWDIRVVPRARRIHQPLYTTPFSALWCAFECVRVLRSIAKSSKAVPHFLA